MKEETLKLSSSEYAFEVKDLSYSYTDGYFAVSHVSFCVPVGQYVSIIGHNGSGKSTLSKLLMGLFDFTDGEIFVFGEQLTTKSVVGLRKRIGIVFQNPDNQFIGSTVEDDIAFGLENRRVSRDDMLKVVNEFADKVEMLSFLDKEPSNLSGGQKQRVALAGVLAMKPDILILDEATSMLDPKGRSEINRIILKMKADNPNLTVLSITHDIEETVSSDRILVMNEGQIVIDGTPEEVFARKDELSKIELTIPFFYQIKEELIKRGVEVNSATNIDELVDIVCR